MQSGKLPTKQDLKSIKGNEQDDVVMALTKAIGPDEAIKLVEGMCDMSKHAEKLVSAKGNPDGPLPKWGEPPVDAMNKTPGQKKKKVKEDCWDGYTKKGMKKKGKKMVPNCVKTEEVKTIKVGEDAVGSDKCHYALVMDRKVTAVGTKDEMLAKCKEEGGRVWVSTKQVGDIVEEAELRHILRYIPDPEAIQEAEYHVTRPGGSLKKPDSVHKNKSEAMKAAYRLSGNKHKGARGGQVYRVHKGEVTHGFDTEGRKRHLGLDHAKVTGKKPIREAKYAVDIEGMPRFYMNSDSPGRVKVALRQMLKKANAIKSVTRTYDASIKADLRARLKDASTDMQTNYVSEQEVHARYMRAHGKKASGHGRWAFTTSRHGQSQPGQTFVHTGSFSDAHKKAKKHFGKPVYVMEKLKASDDMGDWVDDFKKSDAPQFKGKSMKKRRQMAIAAKLSAMEETGSWKKDSGWKKTSGDRKDEYGNTVKKQNIAKHLAKKAMNKTKAMGENK